MEEFLRDVFVGVVAGIITFFVIGLFAEFAGKEAKHSVYRVIASLAEQIISRIFTAIIVGVVAFFVARPMSGYDLPALKEFLLVLGVPPPASEKSVSVLSPAGCGLNNMFEIDENGMTSLHHAVTHKEAERAKCLISAGVDINAMNDDGDTPLHVAAKNGESEIVEILIKFGAEINAGNKSDRTPLHLAARHYRPEMAKMLIQAGALINIKDKDGWTPLHHVFTAEVAKALIEAGANPDIKDKGSTYNLTQSPQ